MNCVSGPFYFGSGQVPSHDVTLYSDLEYPVLKCYSFVLSGDISDTVQTIWLQKFFEGIFTTKLLKLNFWNSRKPNSIFECLCCKGDKSPLNLSAVCSRFHDFRQLQWPYCPIHHLTHNPKLCLNPILTDKHFTTKIAQKKNALKKKTLKSYI